GDARPIATGDSCLLGDEMFRQRHVTAISIKTLMASLADVRIPLRREAFLGSEKARGGVDRRGVRDDAVVVRVNLDDRRAGHTAREVVAVLLRYKPGPAGQ